jgi:hypothetical protein
MQFRSMHVNIYDKWALKRRNGRGCEQWFSFPYFTFAKVPDCYAWQITGLTFRDIIVVHVLSKYHG